MRRATWAWRAALACTLHLTAAPAYAQDARLERLAPSLRASVETLVERAEAKGLPSEPLIQKALEGSSKGAAPARVERAVADLLQRMDIARKQLGNGAESSELTAGASALYVGVEPAALARLRAERPHDSLAMPLIALTFFIQRGVTRETSVEWIESLVRLDMRATDWLQLQQRIDTDVRAGAAPRAATATRVEALLRSGPGGQP